jgi:hypothetical protein
MAPQQHAGYKKRGLMGRILVTFGSAALLADLSFLVQPLEHLAERLREGFFGLVPTLGLSVLHAARAIALHQIDYFSLISRILVLFLALVAMVTGTFLWNSRNSAAVRGDR